MFFNVRIEMLFVTQKVHQKIKWEYSKPLYHVERAENGTFIKFMDEMS